MFQGQTWGWILNSVLTQIFVDMTSYLTHHTDHQRFTGSIGVFITFAEEAGLFLHVPPGVQHAAGTETYHRSLPFDVWNSPHQTPHTLHMPNLYKSRLPFFLGIEAGLSDAGLQFLMVGAATDAKCTKTAIMEAKEAMECHPAMSVVGFQVARVSWKCHVFFPPASYDDGGSSSLKQLQNSLKVAYHSDSCGDGTWILIPNSTFFGTKTAGRFLFLQEDVLKKRIQRVVHHVMLMLMTFLLLKICYNFGQQREVSSWFQVSFLCTQQESRMNNLTYIAWYKCKEVISYNKLYT